MAKDPPSSPRIDVAEHLLREEEAVPLQIVPSKRVVNEKGQAFDTWTVRVGAEIQAERDALNAAEADLRHALRQIAELVGGAVSLGASTDMHCAVANEVRVVVADLRAERDALAAEVRRSREQKPVRWAVVLATGHVASVCHEPDIAAEVAATVAGRRVAPLYLAPVVRDHSGVIAQCEEALREWDRKGPHCSATSSLVAVTLTKARNALRGAS